jgi:hypothetical protein
MQRKFSLSWPTAKTLHWSESPETCAYMEAVSINMSGCRHARKHNYTDALYANAASERLQNN